MLIPRNCFKPSSMALEGRGECDSGSRARRAEDNLDQAVGSSGLNAITCIRITPSAASERSRTVFATLTAICPGRQSNGANLTLGTGRGSLPWGWNPPFSVAIETDELRHLQTSADAAERSWIDRRADFQPLARVPTKCAANHQSIPLGLTGGS